jgi:hypothetical protein
MTLPPPALAATENTSPPRRIRVLIGILLEAAMTTVLPQSAAAVAQALVSNPARPATSSTATACATRSDIRPCNTFASATCRSSAAGSVRRGCGLGG